MCTFMDPRVKGTPYLSITERAALHDKIYSNISDMNDKISPADSGPSTSTKQVMVSKLTTLLGDQYNNSEYTTRDESLVWLEIKNYLREAPCGMADSPLTW